VAKFRVSEATLEDIRKIGRYTQQQWGVEQRRSYLTGLDKKFAFLSDNPEISPEQSEFDPSVRIHRHEQHLIVYVFEQDGILIIRLLH
jgi:toxin ParE1/3/4